MATLQNESDVRFKCPVCDQLMFNPYQTTECGHRACHKCLQSLVGKMCPVNDSECCLISIETIFRDRSFERELECVAVKCPKCDACMKLSQYDNHIAAICCWRLTDCQYCHDSVCQRDIDDQSHFKSCSAFPTACNYNSIGCEFIGCGSVLAEHNSMHHGHLLLTAINNIGAMEDLMVMKQALLALQKKVDRLETTAERHDRLETAIAAQNEVILALSDETAAAEKKRVESPGRLALIENQTTLFNVRLAEVDLRVQTLDCTSYDGVLLWKVTDVARRTAEAKSGKVVSLYSQPFYTSRTGYKMAARLYLNGDGMGKNTHVSLFFVIMQGEFDALLKWPFSQRVTFSLMDQLNNSGAKVHQTDSFRPDPQSTSFKRPTTDMNIASGCPLFVSQKTAESSQYLVADCLFIRVVVEVPANHHD